MGRQNITFLYGRVTKPPTIKLDAVTGEPTLGLVYVDVVRSLRPVGDDKKFVVHDAPLVLTREKALIGRISQWKENTIVFIKGTVSTRRINKTSFCPHCTDEDGNPTRNTIEGTLVYVTPIYVSTVKDYGQDKRAAVEDVVENREISNQILVLGTLLTDPKLFTTKQKIQITQYKVALNRKFTIRTDDPTVKTDYPIVKSYGEQALKDKTYLRYQADVLIDGFLQSRTVTRKTKCPCCGNIYEWKDGAMELVPYDVEYVKGHKSNEEVEGEQNKTVEEYMQYLFNSQFKDNLDGDNDDFKSDDVK